MSPVVPPRPPAIMDWVDQHVCLFFSLSLWGVRRVHGWTKQQSSYMDIGRATLMFVVFFRDHGTTDMRFRIGLGTHGGYVGGKVACAKRSRPRFVWERSTEIYYG